MAGQDQTHFTVAGINNNACVLLSSSQAGPGRNFSQAHTHIFPLSVQLVLQYSATHALDKHCSDSLSDIHCMPKKHSQRAEHSSIHHPSSESDIPFHFHQSPFALTDRSLNFDSILVTSFPSPRLLRSARCRFPCRCGAVVRSKSKASPQENILPSVGSTSIFPFNVADSTNCKLDIRIPDCLHSVWHANLALWIDVFPGLQIRVTLNVATATMKEYVGPPALYLRCQSDSLSTYVNMSIHNARFACQTECKQSGMRMPNLQFVADRLQRMTAQHGVEYIHCSPLTVWRRWLTVTLFPNPD